MEKSIIWKIQLGFGIILLIYFLMVEYTIRFNKIDLDFYYLLVGIGGMAFIWGIREVLGALAKQYECLKFKKECKR